MSRMWPLWLVMPNIEQFDLFLRSLRPNIEDFCLVAEVLLMEDQVPDLQVLALVPQPIDFGPGVPFLKHPFLPLHGFHFSPPDPDEPIHTYLWTVATRQEYDNFQILLSGTDKFNRVLAAQYQPGQPLPSGLGIYPKDVWCTGEELEMIGPTQPLAWTLLGDPHIHSTWSDGRFSIDQIDLMAQRAGMRWIGISDHCSSMSPFVKGVGPQQIDSYIKAIRAQDLVSPIQIFAGLEMEIGPLGQLALSNEQIGQLDYVILATHRRHQRTRKALTVTARLVCALETIRSDFPDKPIIIAHPTGRKLHAENRNPIHPDWEALIPYHPILEINSTLDRLDCNWPLIRQLKDSFQFVVGSDTHHHAMTNTHMLAGLKLARKGLLMNHELVNNITPFLGLEKNHGA